MRALLISAALFLATGAAHATDDDQWIPDYRRGYVQKGDVHLTLEDLIELQNFVVPFKKMQKFWQCVADRNERRRVSGQREPRKSEQHCYLPEGKLYGEDRVR